MKVDRQTRDNMKVDMQKVLNYFQSMGNVYNYNSVADMFSLWNFVHMNKKYNDDNRNVVHINGRRLFDYDPNHNFYPCDTNDTTISTALISIAAELQ